jgi:hypothetical protein
MACFSEQTLERELILKLVGEKKGMIQQLTLTPLKGAAATSPRQRLGGESWE